MNRPRSSRCSPPTEVRAACRLVCVSPLTNPPVDRLGDRRSVRLGLPVEHHECRAIGVVAIEQAEQPVKLIAVPAAHLEDARHLPVHRFPRATTRERWRRRVPDRLDDRDGLGSRLGGEREEPLLGRLRTVGSHEEAVAPCSPAQRSLLAALASRNLRGSGDTSRLHSTPFLGEASAFRARRRRRGWRPQRAPLERRSMGALWVP